MYSFMYCDVLFHSLKSYVTYQIVYCVLYLFLASWIMITISVWDIDSTI